MLPNMKIDIKVIPGATKNFIKQEGDLFKIYLQTPPIDGRANEALIDFLANHFRVKRYQIEITKGLKSRHKTVSIENI